MKSALSELIQDYIHVARDRNMLHLATSNFVTVAGSSATILILPLLVLSITGSATHTALTVLASVLGTLFGAQILYPRLRNIHPTDLVVRTELFAAGTVIAIFVASFAPGFQFTSILLSFILLTLEGIWKTTGQYMIKEASSKADSKLVEHFVALNDFSYNVGLVIGPMVIAVVLAILHPRWALLFDASTFVLSAYILRNIRFPYAKPTEPPRLAKTLAIHWSSTFCLLLVVPFLIQIALSVNIAGMIVHITKELSANASVVALIDASGGVAMIVATFIAPPFARLRYAIPLFVSLEAIGFLGMGLASGPIVFSAFQALYYVGLGISANTLRSSLQRVVDKSHIAAVMGFRLSLMQISKVTGISIVAAWLLKGSTTQLYIAAAGLLTIASLLSLMIPTNHAAAASGTPVNKAVNQ